MVFPDAVGQQSEAFVKAIDRLAMSLLHLGDFLHAHVGFSLVCLDLRITH